jgi:flagellar biosynthesis protein FlhF
VTTDTFRVAAREQLETFGQIMGVSVASAADTQSLTEALAALEGRRLVLVDTAGMSQRDPRLPEQLARLAAPDTGIATLLALPATTASGALQEIVDVFRTARPAGCILTKTDEATSLGGALSVLIRSGLPLAYVTDGQRVPEDLHPARAHTLIGRAAQLAEAQREAGAEGHYLLTLGGGAAHAHV